MSWLITGAGADPQLLDAYPGAAAAYSLRDLSWAYGGPVVRVRRSSDNTEQDFTAVQITDGTLTTFCGAGDGFVRTWYDQSGNNRNAGQSNASLQPKIVNAGSVLVEGARPCIEWFSGSISLTFSRLNTIRSYFFLARTTAIGDQGSFPPFLLGDNILYDFHAGSTTWIDSFNASAAVRNGENRINGQAVNLGTTNRDSNRNLFTLIPTANATGSQITADRSIAGRSWRGPIQEILIYETPQTSTRASIEANINAHYAIY